MIVLSKTSFFLWKLNHFLNWKLRYRTRAINNRGLYSGKTFWPLVCGYYSREVTIQEKLFCTAMSTTLFHRNFYKSFQKMVGSSSICPSPEWLSHISETACFDSSFFRKKLDSLTIPKNFSMTVLRGSLNFMLTYQLRSYKQL